MPQRRTLLCLAAICLLALCWQTTRLTPVTAQQTGAVQDEREVGRYNLVATGASNTASSDPRPSAMFHYFVIDTKTGKIWEGKRGKERRFEWTEQQSPVTSNK